MTRDFPISIDTAVEIIGYFIAQISKQAVKTSDPEKRADLERQIHLLQYESHVIYGLEGDDQTRESVFDKVMKFYSPQMKHEVTGQ